MSWAAGTPDDPNQSGDIGTVLPCRLPVVTLCDRTVRMSEPVVVVAQYQTSRIRALWSSYKRIFQLTETAVVTLDPADFRVTNTFDYAAMANIQADPTSQDRLSYDWEGQNFVFSTDHRSHLLCKLFECIMKAGKQDLATRQQLQKDTYSGERVHKNGHRTAVVLSVAAYGIIERSASGAGADAGEGRLLQEYPFVNMESMGSDEWERALFFSYSGTPKAFIVPDINAIFESCRRIVRSKGFNIPLARQGKLETQQASKKAVANALGASISVFDVNKNSRRQGRLVPRQMHITEDSIIERDAAGFRFVSARSMTNIYALVRSWANPREFTVEYNDGSSRTYTCPVRDTLLAMIRDIAHAAGNTRVSVTADASDSERLIPRFATETVTAKSLRENIFGAESIESWYLRLLERSCLVVLGRQAAPCNPYDGFQSVLSDCRAFNANVPCPGISRNGDAGKIRTVLVGLLTCMHKIFSELADPKKRRAMQDADANSAALDPLAEGGQNLTLLMQSVFRLLASPEGCKGFVEVVEVDTRVLLLRGLRFDDDFVNYWALELLNALCCCSLLSGEGGQQQQEFINKHALLTDGMLISLVDLMSRSSGDDDDGGADGGADDLVGPDKSVHTSRIATGAAGAGTGASAGAGTTTAASHSMSGAADAYRAGFTETEGEELLSDRPLSLDVDAAFPAHTDHDGGASTDGRPSVVAHQQNRQSVLMGADQDTSFESASGVVAFFPNSLVIVGASALLESVLASKRDTSSPELMNNVLDLLSERQEILIHMLRSKSFLIMENAALLMHVLLKNRASVGRRLKEAALSEALVIRHFHDGVFSPSSRYARTSTSCQFSCLFPPLSYGSQHI